MGFEGLGHRGEDLVLKPLDIAFDVIHPWQLVEEPVAGFVLHLFRADKFEVPVVLFYPGKGEPARVAEPGDAHFNKVAAAA